MSAHDGGPAFPIADPFSIKGPGTVDQALRLRNGMSLRDHFAGLALSGLLLADLPKSCYGPRWQENVARDAYALADAMLKAREEGGAACQP